MKPFTTIIVLISLYLSGCTPSVPSSLKKDPNQIKRYHSAVTTLRQAKAKQKTHYKDAATLTQKALKDLHILTQNNAHFDRDLNIKKTPILGKPYQEWQNWLIELKKKSELEHSLLKTAIALAESVSDRKKQHTPMSRIILSYAENAPALHTLELIQNLSLPITLNQNTLLYRLCLSKLRQGHFDDFYTFLSHTHSPNMYTQALEEAILTHIEKNHFKYAQTLIHALPNAYTKKTIYTQLTERYLKHYFYDEALSIINTHPWQVKERDQLLFEFGKALLAQQNIEEAARIWEYIKSPLIRRQLMADMLDYNISKYVLSKTLPLLYQLKNPHLEAQYRKKIAIGYLRYGNAKKAWQTANTIKHNPTRHHTQLHLIKTALNRNQLKIAKKWTQQLTHKKSTATALRYIAIHEASRKQFKPAIQKAQKIRYPAERELCKLGIWIHMKKHSTARLADKYAQTLYMDALDPSNPEIVRLFAILSANQAYSFLTESAHINQNTKKTLLLELAHHWKSTQPQKFRALQRHLFRLYPNEAPWLWLSRANETLSAIPSTQYKYAAKKAFQTGKNLSDPDLKRDFFLQLSRLNIQGNLTKDAVKCLTYFSHISSQSKFHNWTLKEATLLAIAIQDYALAFNLLYKINDRIIVGELLAHLSAAAPNLPPSTKAHYLHPIIEKYL